MPIVNVSQLKMMYEFGANEEVLRTELPAEYSLREFQPGDEGKWIRFINETNDFGHWDNEKLQCQIVKQLVSGGGLFLVGKAGIVGCASACHLKEYLPFATLMYVAVHPQDRGKGLGKALTHAAMRVSQRAGYAGMVLNTDDFRLQAIRTYLAVGFAPYLAVELNHIDRWQVILNSIGADFPQGLSNVRLSAGVRT